MNLKYFLLISCLILSSCNRNNKNVNTNSQPDSIITAMPPKLFTDSIKQYNYKIYNRQVSEYNGIKKVEYTVIIPSTYNEQQLSDIASLLKRDDMQKIEYVFVSFYLEWQNINSTNYAISKRTPELNETIINYTPPKKNIDKTPLLSGTKIIGKWYVYMGMQMIIYEKESKYYLLYINSDGSTGSPEPLMKTVSNGVSGYRYVEDTGEFFIIKSDGLHSYFEGDEAAVFSKID